MKEFNLIQSRLEDIVDKCSLAEVINMLEGICYDKADHLECTWQDHAGAKSYRKDAKRLNKMSLDN